MKLRVRAIHFCYLDNQINLKFLKYFAEQIWKLDLNPNNSAFKSYVLLSIKKIKFIHKNISDISNLFTYLNSRNG